MAARSARESGRNSRRWVSRPDATTSQTEAGTPDVAPPRWGTKPIRDQSWNRSIGVPNSSSVPAVSGRSPMSARTSVDLPEPLAPMRARNSPAGTSRSMWRRTGRPPMATAPSVSRIGSSADRGSRTSVGLS